MIDLNREMGKRCERNAWYQVLLEVSYPFVRTR